MAMNKAILIVDDEESICQTLGGILTDEGHAVIIATSGEEALRVVEEELPSLVLLDIWLTGLDGIDAEIATGMLNEVAVKIVAVRFGKPRPGENIC